METKPFNPVEFLQNDDEIMEYLNQAYQDENPDVFVIALGNVAKAKGVSRIAAQTGLNRESLYKVFSGKAKPQWATIHALMHAIGFHGASPSLR